MTLLSRSLHPERPPLPPPISPLPLSHPCGSAQRLPPPGNLPQPQGGPESFSGLPLGPVHPLAHHSGCHTGLECRCYTKRKQAVSVLGTRLAGRGPYKQVCPPLDKRDISKCTWLMGCYLLAHTGHHITLKKEHSFQFSFKPRPPSPAILSNTIAISYTWLFTFKLIT